MLCRFCCCMWHGCSKIKQWSWHIKPFHRTISLNIPMTEWKTVFISYHIKSWIISYHILSYHIISSYQYHIILSSYHITIIISDFCALVCTSFPHAAQFKRCSNLKLTATNHWRWWLETNSTNSCCVLAHVVPNQLISYARNMLIHVLWNITSSKEIPHSKYKKVV